MTNDNADSLSTPAPAQGGAGTGEPWGRSTDRVADRAHRVTPDLPSVENSGAASAEREAPDLVAFVTARLDEREALARAAQPGPWTYDRETSTVHGREQDTFTGCGKLHEVASRRRSTYPGDDPRRDSTPILDVDGAHIAANDPAHVLREVAAMRVIVDRYERLAGSGAVTSGLRFAVEHVAAIWSEHADYQREEWRP